MIVYASTLDIKLNFLCCCPASEQLVQRVFGEKVTFDKNKPLCVLTFGAGKKRADGSLMLQSVLFMSQPNEKNYHANGEMKCVFTIIREKHKYYISVNSRIRKYIFCDRSLLSFQRKKEKSLLFCQGTCKNKKTSDRLKEINNSVISNLKPNIVCVCGMDFEGFVLDLININFVDIKKMDNFTLTRKLSVDSNGYSVAMITVPNKETIYGYFIYLGKMYQINEEKKVINIFPTAKLISKKRMFLLTFGHPISFLKAAEYLIFLFEMLKIKKYNNIRVSFSYGANLIQRSYCEWAMLNKQ